MEEMAGSLVHFAMKENYIISYNQLFYSTALLRIKACGYE